MSSVWSGDMPKFGVRSDFFHGIGPRSVAEFRLAANDVLSGRPNRAENDHVPFRTQIRRACRSSGPKCNRTEFRGWSNSMRYQPSSCVLSHVWTSAMRGAADACCATSGSLSTAVTVSPSRPRLLSQCVAARSDDCRRLRMMYEPALNFLSPILKAPRRRTSLRPSIETAAVRSALLAGVIDHEPGRSRSFDLTVTFDRPFASASSARRGSSRPSRGPFLRCAAGRASSRYRRTDAGR